MRLLEALRASPQRAAIAVSGDLRVLCVRRVCESADVAASLEDGDGWEVLGSGEPIMRATLIEINAIMAKMPGARLDWQPIDIGDRGVRVNPWLRPTFDEDPGSGIIVKGVNGA